MMSTPPSVSFVVTTATHSRIRPAVRFYVDADSLLELWDELVVPPPVREAWASWIEEHRRPA